MRTIWVHLLDASPEQVHSCLDAFARPQPGACWLYPPSAPLPSLYINLTSILTDVPEDAPTVMAALHRLPDISVAADVSGRVSGIEEIHAFVGHLLSRFTGVATDDYTDHPWSLEEIRTGTKVRGHGFFDYDGWHKSATVA